MNKKNILLVFTDQQRYDTIEALGNSVIKTPVLNSLFENGVSFDRAYTPCPVCIPARFSMHTGQMPHRVNCFYNHKTSNDKISFMEILKENGYQTHGVGKMHFAQEDRPVETLWGFESRDVSEGQSDINQFKTHIDNNGYSHVCEPLGLKSDMYYIPQPSQLPERLHNTTWVADKSIEFLEKRDENRPFMLMTSFVKPHPPFETPTPWNKLYRGPEMTLPKRPDDSENLITFWNKFQNRYKYRDQGIDDNLMRQIKAAYYSSISFIDYNLGRLIDYMNQKGLTEDTLIIFTADHGEMLGDYNCVGKRNFLDASARIPMLVSHPDLPKGMRCSKPVNLVDILPTFLDYADIKNDEDYSGKSLLKIVNGSIERDITFGQYHKDEYAMYMAVTENYKYIYSAPDQKEWFFDLKTDNEETRNKANNPMYIKEKENMRNRLMNYFKEDGYTSPFDGDNWKKNEIKTLPDDPDAYLLFQDAPDSIPKIPGYEREIAGAHMRNGKFFEPGF